MGTFTFNTIVIFLSFYLGKTLKAAWPFYSLMKDFYIMILAVLCEDKI